MSEFDTHVLPGGARLQAGVPTKTVPFNLPKANGLLLRGVVTATYVTDDPDHPAADRGPTAVYCDVLCYSQRSNQRWVFIPKALVSQDLGSLHNGRIWKPRAAKLDVGGDAVQMNQQTNPADLDGDHVLVGFLDDSLNLPVILRGIPHPKRGLGNEKLTSGHRETLKVADGSPDFWKHKGVFYGVTSAGDFVVDTTRAYATDDLAAGKEPAPAESGASGNVVLRVQPGSKLTLEIGGETLTVELDGPDAKLKLGDGAKHVAIVEHLQALYDQLKTKLDAADAHVHPTGVGPSGPPTIPVAAPAWDGSIASTKVSLPDG